MARNWRFWRFQPVSFRYSTSASEIHFSNFLVQYEHVKCPASVSPDQFIEKSGMRSYGRYIRTCAFTCFKGFFHLGSDVHTHYTRNFNSYRPIYAHTNTRLFSIKSVGSTTWNMLPSHIRCAPHLRHFKKMLHAYLINGN